MYGAINVGACVAAYAAGLALMPSFPAWAAAASGVRPTTSMAARASLHRCRDEMARYVSPDILNSLYMTVGCWKPSARVRHAAERNSLDQPRSGRTEPLLVRVLERDGPRGLAGRG